MKETAFIQGGGINEKEEMIEEGKGKVGVRDFVIFFLIPFIILFVSRKLIKRRYIILCDQLYLPYIS